MADATEPKTVPVEEVAAAAAAATAATEQPTTSEPAPPLTGANVDDAQPAAVDAAKDGDEEEDEEERKSRKVTLADLCAKGTALYVKKRYEESAECYAKAAERQAEMNGEMDPENAEILFLYGRSLFKVGQAKSDVLGGKAGGDKQQKKAPAEKKVKPKEDRKGEPSGSSVVEEGKKEVKEEEKKTEVAVPSTKKPLFQFTGDENFEDSDEEEEEGGDEEEEEEEEEDDLAVAFEILDLARVLFSKKLESLESQGKTEEEKEEDGDPLLRHVKERLADTHDLLAEISLENERYPNAITDSRASLKYKQQLYPKESEIIAEAHFKLSLALEFASITTDEGGNKTDSVDQEQRDEAVKELELAIESTKLKLQAKEVDLATMASPEDNELTRQEIADVKDIIADMEQRLVDLRGPPIDLNETLYGEQGLGKLGGILGAAVGGSAAEKQAAIQEAKKTATDLSSLVRKKQKEQKDEPTLSTANSETNGKRKAEDDVEPEETKKAKVEEATA